MRAKLVTRVNAGRLVGRGPASIAVCVCLCAFAGVGLLGALAPASGAAKAAPAAGSSAQQLASQVASGTPSHALGVGAPEPTIATTSSVDGDPNGQVPAPPADVMGTAAASTLVASDQLYMTKIDASGATFNQWATVDPSKTDTGGIGDQGGYGQESARSLLDPNVATAAGRFLDPVTARVLSLKLTKLGDDGLLTLSSANGTADREWDSGSPTTASCQVGDTCSLAAADSGGPTPPMITAVDGAGGSPVSVQTLDPPGSAATGQQWTFVGDGAADGYFELVNESNGLCLSVVGDHPGAGSGVGGEPCPDAGSASVTQLWKEVSDPKWPGAVAFAPKFDSGLALTHSCLGTGSCEGDGVSVQPNSIGTASEEFQMITTRPIAEPGGVLPTWSTVIPSADPATPYAVAAGDLDRVVGADNQYHDEAVVAYAGPDHHLQVRVIDYNANSSHLLVTAPDQQLPLIGENSPIDGRWFPGSVGVAVGSFDGGPLNQIAVTWQDAGGHFHVTLLAYRQTDGGGRALTVLGDPSGITLFPDAKTSNDLASGYAQTTAGDFEGIGRDDLAIAYAGENPDGSNADSGHLGVVSFTPDLTVRGQTTFQFSIEAGLYTRGTGEPSSSHGVRVVPGLFKYDPGQGYDFGRRELAVAWTEQLNDDLIKDRVQVLDVEPSPDCTDTSCDLTIKAQTPVHDLRDENPAGGDSLPISLTAGGFAGQGDGSAPPLWDIAVALPPLAPGSGGRIDIEKVTDSGLSEDVVNTDPDAQYVLTAYDRTGSSLALGAPLIMTVSQLIHGKVIAAQPPSHSDWIGGQMINVSRNGSFALKMGDQETKEYDYSFTTRPGWNVGVTQSLDIKGSASAGVQGLDSASASAEFKQKFAANWSETDATFTKYSTTIQSQIQQTGSDDDIVQGDFVTDYVYRYPILGQLPDSSDGKSVLPAACNSGPCTPFYEVTIPGQVTPVSGLGKALEDFYQPTWQNGNALSYPPLVDGKVPTPDLGSYSYTDDQGQTQTKTEPLMNIVNDVGGGSAVDSLNVTGQTGSGHKTDKANDWTLGGEFTTGTKFEFSVGVIKTSVKAKLSVGVSGGKTFSSTDAGSTTNTSASSFELDVPAIDANKGYEIGTAYYNDTAGVAKVVHAVDLTANSEGREFWQRIYGVHPDPALNLPNATLVTYDDLNVFDKVVFNTSASRQLIRGFYALQPDDPSSPLTSGVPYADDPVAGDPVIFSVKVHNYSLVDSPAFPVQFSAVPVSSDGLNVTGAPVPIGTVQSLPIPAQGMVTVNAPAWSAQAAGGGAQNWRIFVILDPDNTLNEIHPWKGQDPCPVSALDPSAAPGTVVDGKMIDPMTGGPDDLSCGQNNQGYGQITVMPNPAQSLAATPGATVKNHKHKKGRHHNKHANGAEPNASAGVIATSLGATGPAEPAGASLQSSEMAVAGSSGDLQLAATATPAVNLGEPTTVVIHASSAQGTADILPVLVYDGPPSDGHLIATTQLDGATQADGGDAEFTWTPDTPGLHTLYEEMIGTDPSEDSRQTIQINVLPTTEPPLTAINNG
jgi:Ricin-type beta-trefoil lectin domain-like